METRNDLESQREIINDIKTVVKELNRLATRAMEEHGLKVQVESSGISLSGGEHYPFGIVIKKVIYY